MDAPFEQMDAQVCCGEVVVVVLELVVDALG